MMVKILIFGMAKGVVGADSINIEVSKPCDVAKLKETISNKFPELPNFMLAINQEYAESNTIISTNDEIALIPPTNGG